MTSSTATTDFTRWWSEALTLRVQGADTFEGGPAPSAFPRLYGGQVAAQCLVAAASTVDRDCEPNFAHTVFLRGGVHTRPVTYRVERVRESRTLSTRMVRAEQDGHLLAAATVSFHRQAEPLHPRLEHDLGADRSEGCRDSRPPAADPATLLSRHEHLVAAFGDEIPPAAGAIWPVDVRYVDRTPWAQDAGREPCNRQWLTAKGLLPDVPCRQAAALTFASDYPMFEPTYFPHSVAWEDMISGRSLYGASLDHTLWFHRPVRFDEWLLVEQVVPVAAGARAFCRAEIRSSDSQLVASVAQEICFVAPRR